MSEIDLGFDVGNEERGEASEVVPAGRYLLEIVRVKYKEADEDRGTAAALFVTATVMDAENPKNRVYAGIGSSRKSASVFDAISLHPNARWKFTAFMDAVYGRKVTGTKLNTDELIDKRYVCQVSVEEYNGKEKNRMEQFFPANNFVVPADTAGKNGTPAEDEDIGM